MGQWGTQRAMSAISCDYSETQHFTLFRPMEFPIKIDSQDDLLYMLRGLHILFRKIDFANSTGPDELPHKAASHQGLQCLPLFP